jgi:adenylosuccinate lyase
LLAHLKEIEEPFAEKQVGSSAMPYKRNPMRSERICGLARFLISLNENPLYTEATQWFERSLDDSANRRLYLPEAFLTADAILNLLCNITFGMIVHPKVIEKHMRDEIPFFATELILMEAVKRGKDRQAVHERLRLHSLESSRKIKEEGLPCDLLEKIAHDKEIGLSKADIAEIAHIKHFIGRSTEQTQEFLNEHVMPILEKHKTVGTFVANIQI